MPRRAAVACPLFAALALGLARPAAAAPEVVASIKPIHSLAAAVMEGLAEPGLLVRGGASPHSYSLRPSDAARLDHADVVFWVGPAMEGFLSKPLAALAADAVVLEADTIPGLILYPPREGGVWEPRLHASEAAHAQGDGEAEAGGSAEAEHDNGHEAGRIDPHVWLDPGNAKAVATAMAETLARADPANADAYRANADAFGKRVDALDAEIAAQLAPVKDRPFVVFHDAYQYFEAHHGLAAAGSITLSPDQPPGARRLSDIRAAIAERGVACVFREPQFEPALVEAVIDGTGARQGELDPEGAALKEGPELYFELMRGLARNLAGCLGASG